MSMLTTEQVIDRFVEPQWMNVALLLVDTVRVEERERAAKIADGFVSTETDWDNSYWNSCAEQIAASIRG